MRVVPAQPQVPKRLHEMNRLSDMGRFPLAVCCGATGNVLLTVVLTSWFEQHVSWMLPAPGIALLLWLALVLGANVAPVIILRIFDRQPPESFRYVHQMNFFADQHRFSDWVYVVASANMSVWIVLTWCICASFPGIGALAMLLGAALFVTSFPAWLRLFL